LRKKLTVIPERCSGCRVCELVCAISHAGVNNPKKANIRVISLYPHPVIKMPIVCEQCKKPKCRDACPTDAIVVTDGVVTILEDRCISCHACVSACHIGAIFVHEDIETPFKCDMCGGNPKCVAACPKKAILYVPEHTLGQAHRLASALQYANMQEVEYFEHGEKKKLRYAEIETGGTRGDSR
jgi:anaerobic carbon-monoxide dehydrogenase iron sulfur subunit